MTNIEKYNSFFVEVFGDEAINLGPDFKKDNVEAWDSVHQLSLITLAEDEFDLMLDPEDIMAFTSYEGGKEILRRQGIEL